MVAFLGTALLVGAAFVLGAWIGHAGAQRALERLELELEHVLAFRVRVECPGHHATRFERDPRADYGAVLLLDATVRELVARNGARPGECTGRELSHELAWALREVGELEVELAECSLGRVIPCRTCGPGVVCSTCRLRERTSERLRDALDRVALQAMREAKR